MKTAAAKTTGPSWKFVPDALLWASLQSDEVFDPKYVWEPPSDLSMCCATCGEKHKRGQVDCNNGEWDITYGVCQSCFLTLPVSGVCDCEA